MTRTPLALRAIPPKGGMFSSPLKSDFKWSLSLSKGRKKRTSIPAALVSREEAAGIEKLLLHPSTSSGTQMEIAVNAI